MAKRNVYSVICLDEYYNLGSFRIVFRFNHYINLVLSDRGSIYNNHSNLNTIRNIVQYIHNIPHEQIKVGFQFTDRLGNTLKVVFSGDSNV